MSDSVVQIDDVADGVVQITMCDRLHKNTFSNALIMGLRDAFSVVGARESCRAVVLTGYDNYFCSGGTKEGLLELYEGKQKFTDANIYSLALDCPVPVLAAMQGHAIGGGFVMGLFADFVILGRECVYTTNFMKYGFTPGMGATLIVPQKLGLSLAEEMLLSADTFRGGDLKERGVPFPVVPRAEVSKYAVEKARSLAEKPRRSLVTLKNQLVASLRRELPAVIEQEVAMHEVTFHESEVRDRIDKLF
jgi:polyketide biosynthesis enoyl-CoA hydratase PksI